MFDEDGGLVWPQSTDFPSTTLIQWEAGWYDPLELNGPTKATQFVIEAVHGASANIQLTQQVVEAVHGGTPNIRLNQEVVEVVHGAVSNIDLSQLVIEVVYFRSRPDEDYFWTKPIDNEMKFARPIIGDQDTLVRFICSCVARPGMSECVHGNPLTFLDCVSGAPPIYANCLTSLQIPCES